MRSRGCKDQGHWSVESKTRSWEERPSRERSQAVRRQDMVSEGDGQAETSIQVEGGVSIFGNCLGLSLSSHNHHIYIHTYIHTEYQKCHRFHRLILCCLKSMFCLFFLLGYTPSRSPHLLNFFKPILFVASDSSSGSAGIFHISLRPQKKYNQESRRKKKNKQYGLMSV